MPRIEHIFLTMLLALALAGCGRDSGDLPAYVQQVLKRPARPVDPLPEPAPAATVRVEQLHFGHDPFVALPRRPSAPTAAAEPVSACPDPGGGAVSDALAQLRLVRTDASADGEFAIVQTPAGELYRIAVGDAIGPGCDRVADIGRERVVVSGDGYRREISSAGMPE